MEKTIMEDIFSKYKISSIGPSHPEFGQLCKIESDVCTFIVEIPKNIPDEEMLNLIKQSEIDEVITQKHVLLDRIKTLDEYIVKLTANL